MGAKPLVTVKARRWSPYIEPVALDRASAEQLEAMKVTPSGGKVSDYVRTLAHDPESYVARTILFNAIMYAEGGLPRPERELGALAASMVNCCVYCASVHARRHVQLTGASDVVGALYVDGLDAELDPRSSAIVAFARKLSGTPPRADPADVEGLRQVGLSEAEILDLVHAVAIFGFANRLMHPLGGSEPLGA